MNSLIIDLAKYEAPQVVEDKREDWVGYGEDGGNSYYCWLIERYRNSPTNNAIVNNMSRLIYGRGVHALDASRKTNEYAQMRSIFSNEDLKNVIADRKLLGEGKFQVHWNKQHTKVLKAYHIPSHLLLPEKCNKDGEIEAYYYSDNWEDTKKFPPKRIPTFGTSKEEIEIYCVRSYSVGMKYFGELDYQGCLPYTVLEEEISSYLINEVQNGFSGTKVINFNNGVPDEEKRDEISRDVKRKLTGSKGQRVIVAFNNNAESKTTVDDIPLNDAPEHYEYLSKECEQKILIGHNVVSPMLVGVVTDNQGFSSNADEIETAAKYFHNISIKPFQDEVIDAMDQILAVNGVSLDLYFRRLNLLEDIEEKEQEKEETRLSNEADFLSSFGEEVGEDWELIDEREVDYDLEDDFDAQIREAEERLKPKKSMLSKLVELIGTGRARPNTKSTQDQEVDGFYFKVRYKYVGNESPERDFCKAMMRANKVYRKEDILSMSSQGINRSHGHEGQPYNIFLYKGGVNCHHKWLRQTYVSTSKRASIGSHKTSQVSTNKAEKFGYRVRNPKEVAMMPKDMPNNGHHPDYNG